MTDDDRANFLRDLAATRVVALELRLLYAAIRRKLGGTGQLTEELLAAGQRTSDLEERLLALAIAGAELIAQPQQQDGDDLDREESSHRIH